MRGDNWRIEKLAVLGVGLIGGSVAAALKERARVVTVVGCGRSQDNLDVALSAGIIDSATQDPEEAIDQADVVLIAAPVGATADLLERLSGAITEKMVVTDVGSTKAGIVSSAKHVLGDCFARFVPGHPVAGSERSGAVAAQADLFVGHWTVLTPTAETDPSAIDTVRQLWEEIGSHVRLMEPETHDRVLGMTSHLPHATAYALVAQLAQQDDKELCFEMAAGGFLDLTRIASSDPVMWRDIFLDNRATLVRLIDQHLETLASLRECVSNGDGTALESWFEDARDLRDRLIRARSRKS